MVLTLAALFGVAPALCGDLDDGISKYNEDAIGGWDELGSKDRNIKYTKLNAKSRAKVRAKTKDGEQLTGATGGANMNSVVMGAGSNVRGDIIIIDESKGPKTIVTE
jgi:hypothetical protein